MNKLIITAAAGGALAATALGLAGAAQADAVTAYGGSSVADTIRDLRAQGYDVQLNSVDAGYVALSRCTVSDVDGLQGRPEPAELNTVYINFWCPENI